MLAFKKSEMALFKWYNEQIKRAWAEKDGNRALLLEREVRAIGLKIREDLLNRK